MRHLLAVIVTAVVVMAGAPAHADDRLGLSRDGSTWSPALTTPLFSAPLRWVPGDVRTESFWVRNQSTDAAQLSLTASRRGAAAAGIEVRGRVGSGSWVLLDDSVSLTGGRLAAGERRRVDVRVSLPAGAGNTTQRLTTPVDFTARLVSVEAGPGDDEPTTPAPTTDNGTDDNTDENTDDGTDDNTQQWATTDLPATGSVVDPRIMLGALGALGTGFVLLAGRRRNTAKDEER